MNLYVYLKGGLGNQMFQYASGLSALKEYSQFTNLKLDTSFYIGQQRKIVSNGLTGRGYDLDLFNITYTELEVAPEGAIMLDGYYQNIYEFENVIDQVRSEFTFKNKFDSDISLLAEKIANTDNSVCIHVRRGDYVYNPTANSHHGVMGVDYYESAQKEIEKIILNPIYYVFSEDIEWCKENLKSDCEMYFIGNKYCGDRDSGHLYLMQMCQNHIISNSSFSWWAAFLSDSKNTIAPKKWRLDGTGSDIILDNWISL